MRSTVRQPEHPIRHVPLVLVLTVAALLLAACGGDPPSTSVPSSTTRHVGEWKTEPFLSQRGMSIQELRLGADGEFEFSHHLTQAGLPQLRTHGTYRLEGDRLVLHGEFTEGTWVDTVYTWRWDGPALVLTEENGDSYRFLRRAP